MDWDYIKKCDPTYPLAVECIKKWFDSDYFKKIKNYKNLDLGEILKDEFIWFLEPIFDDLKLIKNIIKKEGPDKIIIPAGHGLFAKTVTAVAKTKKIEMNIVLNTTTLSKFSNDLIKNLFFKIRFFKLPGINRREFVKTKEKIGNEKEKNVMLLGLDDTYFNRLGAIPNELKNKKLKFFSLCTHLDMQKILQKKDIKFFSFGDFLNSNIKKDVEKKRKKLSKYWKTLKGEQKFKKIFYYRKINLFDIIEKEIEYLIKIRFPWIMYYIETARKCFDSQKVNMVVSIDDTIPIVKNIIMLAKLKKIPSLVIQKGITSDSVKNLKKSGRGFVPLIADKFAAWGKISKEYLVKRGTRPERVVITGNPQFEFKQIKVKDSFYKKLGLDKNKKIVLLATDAVDLFSEKEFSKLTYALIKILRNFPDKQLIIKIHPRESKEMYEKIIRETDAKRVYVFEENLRELASICEVLITIASTAALDALIINKPVIIANFFDRHMEFPFVQSGATINVINETQLSEALKNINKKTIKKNIKEKFLYNCLYKKDNGAGERIIELIEKMTENKK